MAFKALAERKEYTIEDIYALPVDVRAELIDGQIYYMPAPNTMHQRLLSLLVTQINNYIASNG